MGGVSNYTVFRVGLQLGFSCMQQSYLRTFTEVDLNTMSLTEHDSTG